MEARLLALWLRRSAHESHKEGAPPAVAGTNPQAIKDVIACVTCKDHTGIGWDLLRAGMRALEQWVSTHRHQLQSRSKSMIAAIPAVTFLLSHGDTVIAARAASFIDSAISGLGNGIAAVNLPVAALTVAAQSEPQMAVPALGAIAKVVVSGTDEQVKKAMDAGILTALGRLLTHTSKDTRTSSCKVVKAFCARSTDHIQAVINSGILPTVVASLRVLDCVELDVAAGTLLEITKCGNSEQIRCAVDIGCLGPLVMHLREHLLQPFIATSLLAMENILRTGEGVPFYVTVVRATGEGLGVMFANPECATLTKVR
eukprot:gene56697-biopygen68389